MIAFGDIIRSKTPFTGVPIEDDNKSKKNINNNNKESFNFGDIIRGHIDKKKIKKENNNNNNEPKKVYFLESIDQLEDKHLLKNIGKYKIGFTKDIPKRIKDLDPGNPDKIICVASKTFNNAYRIEQMLHREYKEYRRPGKQEWYNFPIDIAEDIKRLLS